MTIEYTVYERPRRLASSIHMPAADIAGALRFDPVPTGTRMGWSWVLRAPWPVQAADSGHRPRGPASGAGELGWAQAVPRRAGGTGAGCLLTAQPATVVVNRSGRSGRRSERSPGRCEEAQPCP
ncbi:MAG TPA: hypothetical protein VHM23_05775 [Actinomycetota bacterium]|nr:hypothetical protein [Actinomycetota bacterium]